MTIINLQGIIFALLSVIMCWVCSRMYIPTCRKVGKGKVTWKSVVSTFGEVKSYAYYTFLEMLFGSCYTFLEIKCSEGNTFLEIMKRYAYTKLLKWKNNKNRKPLIMQGARQVGKTYLVKEFGEREYQKFYYLNFEQDNQLLTFFEGTLSPEKILQDIGLYLGERITAKDSLIFFDEIQMCSQALTSLKYFQELAPEYHIISAGSLLGVSVGVESSFPVGKVNFMTLYPMSFFEFLPAIGESLLVDFLLGKKAITPISDAIHTKLDRLFKLYLFIGGMPEAVKCYIGTEEIRKVRKIQKDILKAYSRDFSKYAEKNQALKNSEVWDSIPRQLAKENKKFKYSDVKKRARASMYETSIEWMKKAGLVHLVHNVEMPKKPLSGYANYAKFKIYMHDTGLLAAQLNITSDIIVSFNRLFIEYNGAFIENYVAQTLKQLGEETLFYWTSKSDAEVDFLFETSNEVIPIEVKSGTSKNMKSIRSYSDKYNPSKVIRLSPRNFTESGDFMNIPLYALPVLMKLIHNLN